MTIVEGLENLDLITDAVGAMDARHMEFSLFFTTTEGSMEMRAGATIRQHSVPVS